MDRKSYNAGIRLGANRCRFCRAFVLVFLAAIAAPCVAGRTSNLVEVVTAGFVGGKGTEWFTAGAFPGDDSIIIAGISMNPEVVIHGVKASVLGKDAAALPAPKDFRKLASFKTGEVAAPKLEDDDDLGLSDDDDDMGMALEPPPSAKAKKAKEDALKRKLASVNKFFQFSKGTGVGSADAYVKLSWQEPAATGFIGRFDSSLKKVRTLYRFPRGSCGITSISVGKNKELYVAGFANERISGACDDFREEKPSRLTPGAGRDAGADKWAFIACLEPDLASVRWVRKIEYVSYAPKVTALHSGNVVLLGPGYMEYTPDGKLGQVTAIRRDRVMSAQAVCPVSGRYSIAGDWLGMTGREPMRMPRLSIMSPNGLKYKHLCAWDSSFFCPNHFHIVADSAVRRTDFDNKGNMVYSTWSHGGNNCLGRLPYDPETRIPDRMYHTGGQTYCYVIKLDPEQNVTHGMLWTSAGSVRTLSFVCDGSVAWAGNARGILRKNALSEPVEGQQSVVVVNPNMTGYRFWSPMPIVGNHVVLSGSGSRWNQWSFSSGICAGKPLLLALSGSVAAKAGPEEAGGPPVRNPVQPGYGGGVMDGYALLMDLTPKVPLATELAPPRKHKPRKPKPMGPDGHPVRSKDAPPLVWPEEGQVWNTGQDKPKPRTVIASFRDEDNEKWPTFFGGHGLAGGSFTSGEKSAKAEFTLHPHQIQQWSGLQHQRILGELVKIDRPMDKNGKFGIEVRSLPEVKIHVTGMAPWEKTTKRSGLQRWPICRTTLSGILDFSGKQISFKDVVCTGEFTYPHRVPNRKWLAPNYGLFRAHFHLLGKELGLAGDLAEKNIRVRFAWEAKSKAKFEVLEDPNAVAPPSLKDSEDKDGLDLGL